MTQGKNKSDGRIKVKDAFYAKCLFLMVLILLRCFFKDEEYNGNFLFIEETIIQSSFSLKQFTSANIN